MALYKFRIIIIIIIVVVVVVVVDFLTLFTQATQFQRVTTA